MYNCCMDSMHPQIHPQLPAMFPGLCCPQRRTKEVQGLLSSRTELNGCYWESWGMTCHATLMSKAEGKVARVWKGFNITSWFGRRFRISVLQWRAGKTWGVMVTPKHLPPPLPQTHKHKHRYQGCLHTNMTTLHVTNVSLLHVITCLTKGPCAAPKLCTVFCDVIFLR